VRGLYIVAVCCSVLRQEWWSDMDERPVFLSCPLCVTLQHSTTCCNTPQHSGWSARRRGLFVYRLHTATHCNTLRTCSEGYGCEVCVSVVCAVHHTATHCNTLQHTATHCNTLQHTANEWLKNIDERWVFLSCTLCNTLHHSATHYKRAVEKYG